MKRELNQDYLRKAMLLIGKKYDLLILDTIFQNRNRLHFNQILKNVVEMNPRILSMRLKELESNKLVTKNIVIGTPVKTIYSLTEKAEKIVPIVDALKKWASKN